MSLLLGLFSVGCVLLLTAAVIRQARIYEYPYFMAATFVVFIAPQLFGLYQADWAGQLLETTTLMALLCLAACWLGYLPAAHPALIEKFNVRVNTSRFLQGGFILVAIAWYFNYRFESLSEDEITTTLTGRGTVYLFFSGLIYPGFAICFYCAVKNRNVLAWIGTLAASVLPIQTAVFHGRREPTVLFLLTLAASLYFLKSVRPPRWAIVGSIIAAMFVIPAIGDYRTLAKEDPLAALKSIDFKEKFSMYFDEDGVSEVKNAAALIAATEVTQDYEWGAGYWNRIVFRFAPAQFMGEGLKNAFMIGGQQRDFGEFVENAVGAHLPEGATVTGIGDAFNEFGYFGCLVFASIGYLFKNLWAAANHEDGTMAQILYIQVTTSGMRALTHQTIDFLPGFLYSAIFIGLVALYARERQPEKAGGLLAARAQSPSANPTPRV